MYHNLVKNSPEVELYKNLLIKFTYIPYVNFISDVHGWLLTNFAKSFLSTYWKLILP